MAAPLLLTLDTATPRGVLALGRPGDPTASDASAPVCLATEEMTGRGRQASTQLGSRLAALLEAADAKPSEIGAVACGVGPGMFTGVRVAVATAKGIALGLGVPAFPVSTLAAIACSADDSVSTVAERLALIDARRGEVYAARFTVRPGVCAPQGPPRCVPIGTVLDELAHDAEVLAIGSGVSAHTAALDAHPGIRHALPLEGPSASGLWHASTAAAAVSEASDASALSAVYLRASYAELGVNPPKRPFVKSPFV